MFPSSCCATSKQQQEHVYQAKLHAGRNSIAPCGSCSSRVLSGFSTRPSCCSHAAGTCPAWSTLCARIPLGCAHAADEVPWASCRVATAAAWSLGRRRYCCSDTVTSSSHARAHCICSGHARHEAAGRTTAGGYGRCFSTTAHAAATPAAAPTCPSALADAAGTAVRRRAGIGPPVAPCSSSQRAG